VLPSLPIIILVTIATVFGFFNGAKDGANALATIITSRAVSPSVALWMVSLGEFAGPYVFGVAVATTIGANVVDINAVTTTGVIAALLASTTWNVLMWRLGLPTSSSHALVGGLLGSVMMASHFHWGLLHKAGLLKIGAGLFLAPLISLVVAALVMRFLSLLLRNATPRVNRFFKRGQVITTLGLALSHGANDSPKTMGLITLGLVTAGTLPEFVVPWWVILLCSSTVAIGTALGGWRLVRTIGTRFYRVRTLHAFNSQLAAAVVVFGASLAGSPVSTSQVVSSAIVGVGAAERLTKVRWGVLQEIVLGWLFTIPATALAGSLAYVLLRGWLGE
jgi:inorganic phosphate transporter, PiT family